MNRLLQIFNLLGVCTLSILLVVQWQVNSRVNERAGALEIVRQQQLSKLEEDERTLRGTIADLDEFRNRLRLAESQLGDVTVERDQLKSTLPKWMTAVAEQDTVIKQAGTRIQQLAAERNDLAGKYEKLVKDWNELQNK